MYFLPCIVPYYVLTLILGVEDLEKAVRKLPRRGSFFRGMTRLWSHCWTTVDEVRFAPPG